MKHNIAPALEGQAVPIGDVKPFPGNARKHDLESIKDSLKGRKQFKPIIVNRRTGHIVKGNGTYAAAKALGWEAIAVSWVDVDEITERRMVLVDNRASELGWFNETLLVEALSDLPDIAGTGYSERDLSYLESAIAGPVDLLPPAPKDPGQDMKAAKERFEGADVRNLVLVCTPAEYDVLLSDLDGLRLDGETLAEVVVRLVANAKERQGA